MMAAQGDAPKNDETATGPTPQPRGQLTVKTHVRDSLQSDLAAGLTVSVVALPQSMAYAILAEAPVVFGLYTSIVSCIVGSLFGSSRHLITGPTNATAIMFAATLADRNGDLDMLPAIALYTLLIGVFKFAFGLLRFGRLADYVSDSVILGFTAGAGILITGNQLAHFLGVEIVGTVGRGFFPRLLATLRHVPEANPHAVALALGTIIVILVLQRINRRIPAALLACVGSAVAVYLFGLADKGVVTTGAMGHIPRSLPPFSLPLSDLDLVWRLGGGAFAVAVIGLMEATSISTSIATTTGQRLNTNREFMAQGLANMVGAFFSNFACSGSFTRSALNYQSGAKTRAAGVFSGIFVAIVVLAFGPLGEYIPIASLAGLLMVVAYQMVNWERLQQAVRAGRESTIVLVATMAATLLLRIDWAIYLGVALSLMFFIRQSSAAYLTVLLPTDEGQFREVPFAEVNEKQLAGDIVLINLIGAMYFASVDDHLSQIRTVIDCEPRVLILRLRRMSNIDSSGLAAIERVHHDLEERSIPLLLCGVDDRLLNILQRSGLIDTIGAERVVASHDLMFNSIEKTLELARSITRQDDC